MKGCAIPACTASRMRRQRGAAMAATVIALPVLGLVIGAAVQLALLFEAKATLNHATLQAARAGMVSKANRSALSTGLIRGLLPLYATGDGITELAETLSQAVVPDVLINSCIKILNPTREAVQDFQAIGVPGQQALEIPNNQLFTRDTGIGTKSQVNVQDANLLKVYVVYGARPIVPIVGPLMAQAMLASGQFKDFKAQLLARGRLPIVASATVRMQSPARFNSYMISTEDLREGRLCTDNLIPSFLDFDFLDPNTQVCLVEKGGALIAGSADCLACRRGPTSRACISCLQDLGSLIGCFLGNDPN